MGCLSPMLNGITLASGFAKLNYNEDITPPAVAERQSATQVYLCWHSKFICFCLFNSILYFKNRGFGVVTPTQIPTPPRPRHRPFATSLRSSLMGCLQRGGVGLAGALAVHGVVFASLFTGAWRPDKPLFLAVRALLLIEKSTPSHF